jgi:hypothetical protein
MYALWSKAEARVPAAPAEVGQVPGAPLAGALAFERDRQQSINLLRERAFKMRESNAEQRADTQQAELVELRAALAAERQSSQRKVDDMQAQIDAAKAQLAAAQVTFAEKEAQQLASAQARQSEAVSKAVAEWEGKLRAKEREAAEEAQRHHT